MAHGQPHSCVDPPSSTTLAATVLPPGDRRARRTPSPCSARRVRPASPLPGALRRTKADRKRRWPSRNEARPTHSSPARCQPRAPHSAARPALHLPRQLAIRRRLWPARWSTVSPMAMCSISQNDHGSRRASGNGTVIDYLPATTRCQLLALVGSSAATSRRHRHRTPGQVLRRRGRAPDPQTAVVRAARTCAQSHRIGVAIRISSNPGRHDRPVERAVAVPSRNCRSRAISGFPRGLRIA